MTVTLLLLTAAGCFLIWRYVTPTAVSMVDAIRHSWLLKGALLLAVAGLAWAVWDTGYWYLTPGVAAVSVGVGWHRFRRSGSIIQRWSRRSRRTHGVATTLDIVRNSGRAAVRKKATTVRPSLADRSRIDRLRLPTSEVAVKLARVGVQTMYASTEDVIAAFGGPRTGKTGWAAGRIIDAPGACLATSTRPDLYHMTSGIRAKRGPVYVFNAAGLAGLDSTISFDPLTGCSDPVTAQERATDLIAAGSGSDQSDEREWWDGQGRRVLAALLHAAALGNRHMRDVMRWVADPDAASQEVLSLLRRSDVDAFVPAAVQFLTQPDKTRGSVTTTIMPTLDWLSSPTATAAAYGSGQAFDVAELLTDRATIYLLGAEEAHTAPLICALTGHLAREARRLAALQPGGRLDPNFTLVLDEAANVSPVPLESWTSDMGGRGVTIILAFQSRAQLLSRWGAAKAAIILNNIASILLFGGTKDESDLNFWTRLPGDRDESVDTRSGKGQVTSRSVRKVPVFSTAHLSNLPKGKAVIFCRGQAPAVGRIQMAWNRRDVRSHQRSVNRQPVGVTVSRPGWKWSPAAVSRVVARAVSRG